MTEREKSKTADRSTPLTEESSERENGNPPPDRDEERELREFLKNINRTKFPEFPTWIKYSGLLYAVIVFISLGVLVGVMIQDVDSTTRVYGPTILPRDTEISYRIAIFNPLKNEFYRSIKAELSLLSKDGSTSIFLGKGVSETDSLSIRIKVPSLPTGEYLLLVSTESQASRDRFKFPVRIADREYYRVPPSSEDLRYWRFQPHGDSNPYRAFLFTESRALVADLPNWLWLWVERVQPSDEGVGAAQGNAKEPFTFGASDSSDSSGSYEFLTPGRGKGPGSKAASKELSSKSLRTQGLDERPASLPATTRLSRGTASTMPSGRSAGEVQPSGGTASTMPSGRSAGAVQPSGGTASTMPSGRSAGEVQPSGGTASTMPSGRSAGEVQPSRGTAAEGENTLNGRDNGSDASRSLALPAGAVGGESYQIKKPAPPMVSLDIGGSKVYKPATLPESGLIRFSYIPLLFETTWKVSIREGSKLYNLSQQIKAKGYQLVLHLPKLTFSPGEILKGEVRYLSSRGTLYVDLVKNGYRIRSHRTEIVGSKAAFAIPLPPKGRGIFSVQVYTEFYFPSDIYDVRPIYIGSLDRQSFLRALRKELRERQEPHLQLDLDRLLKSLPPETPLEQLARPAFGLLKAPFVPPKLAYDSTNFQLRALRSFQARFKTWTIIFLSVISMVFILALFIWLIYQYYQRYKNLDEEAQKTQSTYFILGTFLFFLFFAVVIASIIYLFWSMKWIYDI